MAGKGPLVKELGKEWLSWKSVQMAAEISQHHEDLAGDLGRGGGEGDWNWEDQGYALNLGRCQPFRDSKAVLKLRRTRRDLTYLSHGFDPTKLLPGLL